MSKRILQIIPTLDRAGAEKQLAFLAAGLPRNRFDVHVAVLTRTGPYAEDLQRAGVPVTLIGKTWKVDPLAYWRLRQLMGRLRPDLVQTWLFAANAYGRAAALAAGVRHVVASEQCADPWKTWHHLAIDRRLARRTARIVVNAGGVRDFYVARGIPADKFVLIPNGIEPCRLDATTRSELLDELGLPGDARLIAAVGRLWPQKRLRDAIWAADLLKVIRDDVHLLVIGDGPECRRLMRFRDQVQIRDRVHFLGHREDVPRMMRHFDLLWQASGYEGLPNTVMEALAAGVPVVGTDIPGNRELVIPGQTGYLVPVGDRAALARYANKILNDPPLAERLGQTGRRMMIDRYPIGKMITSHATLYDDLLSA